VAYYGYQGIRTRVRAVAARMDPSGFAAGEGAGWREEDPVAITGGAAVRGSIYGSGHRESPLGTGGDKKITSPFAGSEPSFARLDRTGHGRPPSSSRSGPTE
jgi:hypothetical protein